MVDEQAPKVAQIDRGSLERTLTLSDVFAIGYGDLGSSIYYALGITALFALGATPIALGIAGFVFACTALTYAEMSSMVQDAGGSASFVRLAFNDLISFIAGWALMLDFIVTIAISAFSVAPYLSYFFPLFKHRLIHLLFTVFILLILFGINIRAAKSSTRLSWILTALTLFTQGVIIVIGVIHFRDITLFFKHMVVGGKDAIFSPSWNNFWKGTAMAMVAYTGIESMAQLASETKKPEKTIPRAMMIAMATLLVMYLLISMVALTAMTPQLLSTRYLDDPLSGVVAQLPYGQQILGPWVGLLGAILLFVASNAGMIGASRLAFNMAELYQLPRFFSRLHSKYKTPVISLIIFTIMGVIVIIATLGKLEHLADLYNFGAMMAFFAVHLALVVARFRFPDTPRPFKSPINIPLTKKISVPLTAVLGFFATFGTWVLVVVTKPIGRYVGFSWLVVGIIGYFFLRKKAKIAPTAHVEIEKIPVPEFKPFKITRILVPMHAYLDAATLQVACELSTAHNASIIAVHVIRVPFSIPAEGPLPASVLSRAETSLKRAEAIARDHGVPIELKLIRARSISQTLVEIVRSEGVDLVVLGTQAKQGKHDAFSALVSTIMRHSPARVFVCVS